MNFLALTRRRLGRVMRIGEQCGNTCLANGRDPAFWQETAVRLVWRRPFWFTDKYGVTLRLHPHDPLRHVLTKRLHFDDEGTLQFVRKIVKPGMTIIDVGSNIGQFTVFSALLVGRSGSVHGFEPAADSFKRLCENTSRLDDRMECVHVNRLAVGKENREIVLHIYPPGCSAWNSLNPHTMYNGDGAIAPCRTENVRMVTLDDYCRLQKIDHINLLKVDVEGFEVDVLDGCRRLIMEKRIDHIIFEISLETLKGTHWTGEGILHAIREMSCDVHAITSDGSLEKVKMPGFKLPYFANYFATLMEG